MPNIFLQAESIDLRNVSLEVRIPLLSEFSKIVCFFTHSCDSSKMSGYLSEMSSATSQSSDISTALSHSPRFLADSTWSGFIPVCFAVQAWDDAQSSELLGWILPANFPEKFASSHRRLPGKCGAGKLPGKPSTFTLATHAAVILIRRTSAENSNYRRSHSWWFSDAQLFH